MNNKRPYAALETVFSLMLVVPLLLVFWIYYDHLPSYGLAITLLSAVSILVGGIGMIVVIVLRHFALKRNPNITGTGGTWTVTLLTKMPDGDSAQWSVNDHSIRGDYWRCNLYVLTHRRQMIVNVLLTPFIFSCIFGLPVAAGHPLVAIIVVAGVFLAWTLYVAFLLGRDMMRRYPSRDSVREITTTLTGMGFEDIIGNRQVFIPWTQVVEIREHQGDVYLWRQGNTGNYITRNAFSNVMEAREFSRKAAELWKNPMPIPDRLRETPEAAYQSNVWPPPPQV